MEGERGGGGQEEKKLLHTAARPPQKFSFKRCCAFCLKTELDSFICEASQLGGIFLQTYLDAQTVSPEHESPGLRKSSHTSAERDRRARTHAQAHTHARTFTYTDTLTLKIAAALLLTLVNVPHPRQLDLHIFNVSLSLSLSSLKFLLFHPFPSSLRSLSRCLARVGSLSCAAATKRSHELLRATILVPNDGKRKEKQVGEIFSNCRN